MKRVVGAMGLTIGALALALGACSKKEKKPKADKGGEKPPAMAVEMAPPMAMTPTAMKPAMKPAGMAGGLDVAEGKTAAQVDVPKGKNPLAAVDIKKGFGEGWFGKTAPMTPPMLAPMAMEPTAAMQPVMAAATGVPPAPADVAPIKLNAKGDIVFATYVHPNKSFSFRYPEGWKVKAMVRELKGGKLIFVHTARKKGVDKYGAIGARAFIVPKAPDTKNTCVRMQRMLKRSVASMEFGELRPLAKSGLGMFSTKYIDGAEPHRGIGICGSVRGRIMFLSYAIVGKSYANRTYGVALGRAAVRFSKSLLK